MARTAAARCSLLAALACLVSFAVLADARKVPKTQFSFPEDKLPVVTGADFREKVMDPTLPVVIAFYDPTSPTSADAGPGIIEAAAALDGHVRFVSMDGTSDQGKGIAEMFGVRSLPVLLLFNPEMLAVEGGQEGQYMKFPAQLPGKQSAKAIVKWALEMSAGHEIARIDDLSDWKDFADRYQALDLPKVILITSGNVTSPLFKTMSHEFRYGAQFAVVHGASLKEAADAARGDAAMTLKGEVLAHLGLGAKPQLDALPVISIVTGNAANTETEVVRESSSPDFGLAKLKEKIAKHAWPEAKRKEMMSWFLEDAAARRKKEAQEAKVNKALPPMAAMEASTWEEHCVKRKKGICAAVFVENPDDESLMAWLEVASKKMAQRVNTPSRLVVVNALQQPALAQFFGATDMGLPTVVFINPGRRQFHNLIGSFSERGVVSFFADKVTKAKGKTFDPKKVPDFVEQSGKGEEDPEDSGDSTATGASGTDDVEEINGDL